MLSQLSYSPTVAQANPSVSDLSKDARERACYLAQRSCRSGGIGIRRALKMPRSQDLVGSSPTSGTGVSSVNSAAARVLALLVLLSTFWLSASAEAQRRDFVGRVVSIDAQSLAVKDRRANILTFVRADNTVVEGKDGWQQISPGDKVLVRWNLTTQIARHVVVIEGPPKATKR
jgi:hypothetical protein